MTGRSTVETARLFVAAPIEDPLRESLRAFLRERRRETPEVKWLPADQLHVTLRFLGEVTTTRLDEVIQEIRELLGTAPDREGFRAGELGFFRRADRHVLRLSLRETRALEEVARALAAPICKVPPERRSFVAHVTLARVQASKNARILEEWTRLRAPEGRQETFRIVLYRSLLLPGGARHEELASF